VSKLSTYIHTYNVISIDPMPTARSLR